MKRRALYAALALAGAFAADSAPAQEEPTELDAVVVNGERVRAWSELERDAIPGGVSVISGEEFHRRRVANLADMLRYVPGMWSESSAGSEEVFFSSRGSNLDATDYDRNGVKLLQDGLPVTAADGNNHNRIIDPLSARLAVVARGANALSYGASTLGGAIDFISPTARDVSPLSLFVNGGSHGSRTLRATGGVVLDAFDALATLDAKSWAGYRDHSRQDREAVHASLGWRHSDDVTMRVYATHLVNEQELPGALTRAEVEADPNQADPAAINGDYGKHVEATRLAVKWNWAIDARSEFEFGLSREEQSLYHPIVEPVVIDGVEVFSLLIDTDHRNAGAMLRYRLRAGDHDVITGVNYAKGAVDGGNYRNAAGRRNGLTEHVDNDAHSLEAYVVDRWQLAPAWKLIYGVQLVDAGREVRTTRVLDGSVRNPQEDYTGVNPRVGVIYAPDANSEWFGSLSRLFEAPTNFELEDDVRGSDTALDPMRGTVLEIGTRGRSSGANGLRWHWDVAAYYAEIRDEILSVDDPDAPGNSLATNVDRTIHAGIEALLGASLAVGGETHRIEPLLSVTVNEFSFDADPVYGDNVLPAAPDYFVRGEVLYRHVGGFYIGPTLDFVGRRFADFSNTYTVDGHALLGLRAGYSGAEWELFAELRNLLDEDYIATLGVLNRADAGARVLYPGAPLSAYAGLRWQL